MCINDCLNGTNHASIYAVRVELHRAVSRCNNNEGFESVLVLAVEMTLPVFRVTKGKKKERNYKITSFAETVRHF